MGEWILLNNGTADQSGPGDGSSSGTFRQLGITSPKRFLTNAGVDKFTFTLDGARHDIAPLWPYGSRIQILHPNSTTWFSGTLTSLPRFTSGPAENQSYELSGPMHLLQQNVFKLVWPGVDAAHYTSHLLLHYAGVGEIETTQTTVARVLNYVLSLYTGFFPPFQVNLADILPGATATKAPIDEVRDILCSEVLRMCMRWHPRSVLWWDYSTNPPTFKLTPQDHLTRVSFGGGNGLPASKISSMNLTPRYDLVRPSVAITYEIASTVDGANVLSFVRDIAPPGATGLEEGCRNLSLDLRGSTVNNVSAYIETTPINTSDIEWWKAHIPALKNSTVYKNLAVKAGSVQRMGSREQGVEIPSLNLPNEVTSKGQFPAWIKAQGIQVQRERVRAIMTYDIYANDGTTHLHHGEVLKSVSITATDADTGSFSTVADAESGDPQPVGLAQLLYDEIKDLQWQCDFTFIDQEVLGAVKPGMLVNITGSRTEFGTMDAVVQTVEEIIDSGSEGGITQVKCGPLPPHEPADILELIRVTRPRVRYTSQHTFDEGEISQGVELGEETADENGVLAGERETVKTIRDETNGREVKIDSGKGAGGAVTPANTDSGASAGAALVTARDGAKIAQLNGSNAKLYITDGTPAYAIDLISADLVAKGPMKILKTKICVKVSGVDKTRTCYVARTAEFRDTDDPA